MAATRKYFSAWQDETFTCACGWAGSAATMVKEPFEALAQYSCAKCEAHLILVPHPTPEEIKEAAAAGHEEARSMLNNVLDGERRVKEWNRDALCDPAQLPELAGDALAFVWDLQDGRPGDNYYVITLGPGLVWRELAFYEDWERFHEIKAILKKKYNGRFMSLTPTETARSNLIGDSYNAHLDPT